MNRWAGIKTIGQNLVSVLLIIAIAGLALSVIVHLLTFLGINPEKIFPGIWLLHIGIFVVWIPTVMVSKKLTNKSERKDFWKVATKDAPPWMKRLCMGLFVYAFFNFFFTIFVLNKGGVPGEINGEKVLHSHGKVIRKLSEEDYNLHQAYGVRTFSGHWMLFYGVAATVLLSDSRRRSSEIQSPNTDAGC